MADNLLTLFDIEQAAKQKLSPEIYEYIRSGGKGTLQENFDALKRIKIRPRVLRNVSSRNLETSILGNKVNLPIGLSPVAFQKISHPDGEMATARAALNTSTVMVLSNWANVSSEEIKQACPSVICFQHLQITRPKTTTMEIVKRAERNNISGLVVTVDQPIRGIVVNIQKPSHLNHARWAEKDLQDLLNKDVQEYKDVVLHGSNTWDDITWLKSFTTLPVILKGIYTEEDALLALKYGADAIWVSNHGGRQLDSVRATIDILPEIVEAVNGKCEVYVDGGFKTGIDVFKGLALGARAVFIGRPIHYGLAYGGEIGVKKVLDILRNELDNTMALSGCSNISDISKEFIHHQCKLCFK